MKEQKLENGMVVEYYDSIEELPIVRHHKFGEMIAVDAGIGSTMDDYDRHASSLLQMINRGDKATAIQQVLNMRQNIQFAIENVSPKSMAFACLVHKVDGVPFTDITEHGMQKLLSVLSSNALSWSNIKSVIGFVKKKWMKKLRSTSLS